MVEQWNDIYETFSTAAGSNEINCEAKKNTNLNQNNIIQWRSVYTV